MLQAFIFVLCQTGLRLNLAKFLEWGPSRRMLAMQVNGTQTDPVHLQHMQTRGTPVVISFQCLMPLVSARVPDMQTGPSLKDE